MCSAVGAAVVSIDGMSSSPATLEVHLAVPIIPDLHFIGSSSPRMFTKNYFPQLSPIHELGKL
jgi:hypothetical protein